MKFKPTDREIVTIRNLYPRPKPEFQPLKRSITDEDKEVLYKRLRSNPSVITGLEWILSPEVEPTVVGIKSIEEIIQSADFIKSNNRSEFFLNVSHDLMLYMKPILTIYICKVSKAVYLNCV